ncbi:hypothetical protein J2129_000887 [Methanofollis sp. W23]|uniref:hypothetical protein n=1 Tax=Methanofollis sp. W23 TaxID=2817849 RepID=UPI001AE31BFD|nr:hypothetical protein [Methanofollis sp. W23]MBP2145433.1 hypothetical protein [Methanofollis sp. W23]
MSREGSIDKKEEGTAVLDSIVWRGATEGSLRRFLIFESLGAKPPRKGGKHMTRRLLRQIYEGFYKAMGGEHLSNTLCEDRSKLISGIPHYGTLDIRGTLV